MSLFSGPRSPAAIDPSMPVNSTTSYYYQFYRPELADKGKKASWADRDQPRNPDQKDECFQIFTQSEYCFKLDVIYDPCFSITVYSQSDPNNPQPPGTTPPQPPPTPDSVPLSGIYILAYSIHIQNNYLYVFGQEYTNPARWVIRCYHVVYGAQGGIAEIGDIEFWADVGAYVGTGSYANRLFGMGGPTIAWQNRDGVVYVLDASDLSLTQTHPAGTVNASYYDQYSLLGKYNTSYQTYMKINAKTKIATPINDLWRRRSEEYGGGYINCTNFEGIMSWAADEFSVDGWSATVRFPMLDTAECSNINGVYSITNDSLTDAQRPSSMNSGYLHDADTHLIYHSRRNDTMVEDAMIIAKDDLPDITKVWTSISTDTMSYIDASGYGPCVCLVDGNVLYNFF
jgi:hypothetical protein